MWEPMLDKFILDGHDPKPVDDLFEWCRWMQTANRTIEKTRIDEHVVVSTVFLGLNHSFGDGPPLLFETMIFGGPHDMYQDRYTTWNEAVAGHRRAVNLALDG